MFTYERQRRCSRRKTVTDKTRPLRKWRIRENTEESISHKQKKGLTPAQGKGAREEAKMGLVKKDYMYEGKMLRDFMSKSPL